MPDLAVIFVAFAVGAALGLWGRIKFRGCCT